MIRSPVFYSIADRFINLYCYASILEHDMLAYIIPLCYHTKANRNIPCLIYGNKTKCPKGGKK